MIKTLEQPQEVVSNIVQFPLKHPQFSPEIPTEYQKAQEQIRDIKADYCDEALEFIMDGVIAMYKNFGYLTDGRRVNTKDMVLLEMAIEGVMYRYYGMDHPIHPIAENAITIEDELESENEQETDEESEDVNGNDTD